MNSLDVLRELEKKAKLSLFEKILAVTNGSITQLLEVYLGEPVKLKTIRQEMRAADEETAKKLDVGAGEDVNFREVEITDGKGNVLVFAKSIMPIRRLDEKFKEDLTKADVPIGKLLIGHKIEARRELLNVGLNGKKLRRTYNLIHKNKILMQIEEEFEIGRFP